MAIPSPESRRNPLQWLVVAVPYFWLFLFFAAPFFIIVKISLSDTAIAMPPYVPVFEGFSRIGEFFSQLDFDNYIFLTEDPLYIEAYLSSLRIAVISTVLLLLVGYPMALAMARAPEPHPPNAGDARHPSVLDVISHPRLRVDRHFEARGFAHRTVPVARPSRP